MSLYNRHRRCLPRRFLRHCYRNLGPGLVLTILAGCVAPGEGNFRRPPTPAEVEQYNAMVQPEERIVCRSEVPIGSNIPVRKCRLVADIDETSAFHREQLRRALR